MQAIRSFEAVAITRLHDTTEKKNTVEVRRFLTTVRYVVLNNWLICDHLLSRDFESYVLYLLVGW
jgi:hypothetical protein